jgi:two-component system chemotaxis sensor kinase CheA
MRLIDVIELAELAHPEWSAETTVQKEEGCAAPLVLVAEDSAFFRRQVTDFLTSKGLEVIGCEDGARAWDYLTGDEHKVQLVITDVEMPNMNGFELCRRIKQHGLLSKLPVIALTSLASEADMARGRDVGIDEYQVKMDRERVMEAVTRLLPSSAKSSVRRHTSNVAAPSLLA